METSRATAVAPLSDGRLQVWSIDFSGVIWTREKTATSSTSDWTSWTEFPSLEEGAFTISVAPLSDGRLQLFAIDFTGKTWSCWKETTEATSEWSSWSTF